MRASLKAAGTVVAAVAFAITPVATAGAATTAPVSKCNKPGMCNPAPNNGWGQAYGPAKPGTGWNGWGGGASPYGPADYCYYKPWKCQ